MPDESSSNSGTSVAIEVAGLSHRYPSADRAALDEVSFTVNSGECFAILGPNGGGKTTLFRILSTMLRPSSGKAVVMGHDVLDEQAQVRQHLGVVFQSPSLDGKLTAEENLRYHGKLYGLPRKILDERINRWLDFFGLSERRNEYVERFSGGMRRKLEVAKALLHEPGLLMMDEPATGLDPAARLSLWQQLRCLSDETGMTLVFTTHLMDEAEACDRLAIMAEGKLVAVDTPGNLKARIGGDVITLEPENPGELDQLAARITDRFAPWEDGSAPTVIDGKLHFEKPDGPRLLAEVASAFPHQIRTLTVGRPTLEDVFMHLTGAPLTQESIADV